MPRTGGEAELPPPSPPAALPPVQQRATYFERPTFGNEQYLYEDFAMTLVNNTALNAYVQVPENEIWFLYCIVANNPDNVTRNVTIAVMDRSAARVRAYLAYAHALTTLAVATFPSPSEHATTEIRTLYGWKDLVVLGGEVIRFTWDAGGASAGGSGYYGYRIRKVIA